MADLKTVLLVPRGGKGAYLKGYTMALAESAYDTDFFVISDILQVADNTTNSKWHVVLILVLCLFCGGA